MSQHNIIIDADEDGHYVETRPREIAEHVDASPSFIWTTDEKLLPWLDIASARVNLRDQLSRDHLVVDMPVTLDPATQTLRYTLSKDNHPLRPTHYKMTIVGKKTNGDPFVLPPDDVGYVKLRMHSVGEEPLSLESTLQALKDAEATLASINNLMVNPRRVTVVDGQYAGFPAEGKQYSDPMEALVYANAYIEENGGVFAINVHTDNTNFISPDRTKWAGYTPQPHDDKIVVTSNLQVRSSPWYSLELDLTLNANGTALNNDEYRFTNTFPVTPIITRQSSGQWRIIFPGHTWDRRNVSVRVDHDYDSAGLTHAWIQVTSSNYITMAVYQANGQGYDGPGRVRIFVDQYANFIPEQ